MVVAHRPALISNSMTVSQAPAEAAGPWTQASASHGVPVYLSAYTHIKNFVPTEILCSFMKQTT